MLNYLNQLIQQNSILIVTLKCYWLAHKEFTFIGGSLLWIVVNTVKSPTPCNKFSSPASSSTYYLARRAFPFSIGHSTRMRTLPVKYTRAEITCNNFPCFMAVPAIPVMSVWWEDFLLCLYFILSKYTTKYILVSILQSGSGTAKYVNHPKYISLL